MVDFDSYIEEAVDTVDKKVSGGMSAASSYTRAYYTGYIYGLRQAKKLFETYEQHAMGEGKED